MQQALLNCLQVLQDVYRFSSLTFLELQKLITALEQRLAWAGLGDFDFELITSYEIMHFCKPHPEYYQEILSLIGLSAEECLMVGNDIGEDLPAGTIGMKTFLVENMLIDNGASYKPDWRGDLNDFYRFAASFK